MKARKTLSVILALALVLSVIAPCRDIVHANDELITLYDDKFEQVTAPVIGEEYYLGADVDGTMMYFRTGTVSDTVPYSLVVTEDSGSAQQVTLEDPKLTDEKIETGFQLTYDNNGTLTRIYCMDVLKDATVSGQTGVMDTGVNTGTAYQNRHNFFIEDLEGTKFLKKTGNNNYLVVKQVPQTVNDVTTDVWRMLGVSELTDDVYPVMLLKEHEHTYAPGEETVDADANTSSRTCTACGYTAVVHGQAQEQVTTPEIGGEYYLSANVNGTLKYFTTGTVTDTAPYSLVTTDASGSAQQVTLEDSLLTNEKFEGGFQFTYVSGETTYRIYCMDVLKDATTAGQTGIMDTGINSNPPYQNRHSFWVDEVDGVKVLRKYGNDNILVVKYNEDKSAYRMLGVPEAELANEGVYPVMLSVAHTHDYTTGKPQGNYANHTEACWCGVVGTKTAAHTYGAPTTSGKIASRTCTACDYVENIYDQKEQVYTPTIGNTYYLAANVNGTLKYFKNGTATDTAPYSLLTTEDSGSAQQVTLEDSTATSENFEGGFQFAYLSGTKTYRIYCMDKLTTEGQSGIMDTAYTSDAPPYKNRHSFWIDEVDGVKVLRKYGNDNILVVKYNEDKSAYRMLGVPQAELANEGVYPVMLLQEHTHEATEEVAAITDADHSFSCWCGGIAKTVVHTYGKAVVGATSATRTCTVCGYTEVIHGHEQKQIKNPEIGETYYLSANVNGTLKYFMHGSASGTTPYSLLVTEDSVSAQQVTLEDYTAVSDSNTNAGVGFQMTYPNPDTSSETTTLRIYCYNAETSNSAMDTGVNGVNYMNRHTFFVDEVGGVKVLRKYGNNNILVVKLNETTGTWRMLGVEESELSNEGVYPVMLSVAHEHTYAGWTFDEENGTQSRLCTVCGFAGETLHGTDTKAYMVTDYEIGGAYYLGANVAGKLKFFTTGTVTNTAPYSLVTTERSSVAVQVTLEDSTSTSENFEGGFQFTYVSEETTYKIYCMDVLKDATTAGQTGIMDTGIQTGTSYKNRHSFWIDEVGGVKVLRKYGNNNILVVKLNETTGTYRMLGVPEAELANEGVYPVMLMNLHEHAFGEELYNDHADGHYHLCECGSKYLISHSFGAWTLDSVAKTQSATCSVCDYKATVASPYFDTVDSLEELTNGLAETVYDDAAAAYTVAGGNDYLLTADVDGERYYFREKQTEESVTTTAAYSLYATDDPNHTSIKKVQVTPGNTEDTYVIHYKDSSTDYAIYVNDESSDSDFDAGPTKFLGVSDDATYIARSEFYCDESTGCLYQLEGGVKYVLVFKELEATYGEETVTEWRIAAVPMANADDAGNYPVTLAQHVHNFTAVSGSTRTCGCGYESAISHNLVLDDSIGVNLNLEMETGETFTATVAGEAATVELADNSVLVPVAAAQMTDDITISANGLTLVTLNVKDIATAALESTDTNDYAKALINHMLAYGGAAQTYFDNNTGNLAGEQMDVTMPTAVSGLEVQNTLTGIEYQGASLLHEGRAAIRFYFAAESVEGLTFTVDDNVIEPTEVDGKYCIEVSGIKPQNLENAIAVQITNGEQSLAISYSPLDYITRTYLRADASDTLKTLARAMYGYHAAAEEYMANKYAGVGFLQESLTKTTLYTGVNQYAMTYVDADYGEVAAYAITVDADASVELKVSAGSWSASSTAEKPGETKTVYSHFTGMNRNKRLAIINGGFFDLNTTKTMKPYGMQIVDGVVKQAPNASDTAHGNNWFGMTTDGKYVISDAADYASTYVGNIRQGVGGGAMLMVEGAAQEIASTNTARANRTAVGVNEDGDLVMVVVEEATYSNVNQIFTDLNMGSFTVLNLDGGGSTAMYVQGKWIPTKLFAGDSTREVADAVGIVKK